MTHQPLRALGLVMLVGGLLAGSLTGCAARRLRAEETATAAAAGQPTAAGANPGSATSAANATASAAATANPADQIDAELDKLTSELNSADTLNDFSTALPLDPAAATATPASGGGGATNTPPANSPTLAPQATTAPSGDDQGAHIEQMLSAMQVKLSQTDCVPEAANP